MMSSVASCAVTRCSPSPHCTRGRPRFTTPGVSGSTALRASRRSSSCPRRSHSTSPSPPTPVSAGNETQSGSRSSIAVCALGRHSATVAAALLLERPRSAEQVSRERDTNSRDTPRLVSTSSEPQRSPAKITGASTSAASAGYIALASAFSRGAVVAGGFPEVCDEVDEVQERDGNEKRRAARSNRRSLRKAMAVPGYRHSVIPLQGLTRSLRKVSGSPVSENATPVSTGSAGVGTTNDRVSEVKVPNCARQTLERSWSACSALDSMDMVTPPKSTSRAGVPISRRSSRTSRGVSSRATARKSKGRVQAASVQSAFAPTTDEYQKYSTKTLQLMMGVSKVLSSLAQASSRGKRGSRNIAGMLVSGKPRDLAREEECTLLLAVKHGLALKALARSMKAQGKDCTYEAVATVAGLPGGSDELMMLDKLAEDAAELLIRQNIGMVMSLAHKYAASSSGGVGYEDLIPFGIEGLNKAMERFDHTRGTRFSTYAHWWIRQACMRGMSAECRVVKVPSWITESAGKIIREIAAVRANPEVPESAVMGVVAKRLEMTEEKMESLLSHVSNATSLDEPISSQSKGNSDGHRLEGTDQADVFGAAPEPTPDEAAELEGKELLLREQIEELLSHLHPRERHIIKMRHGLHSSDETGLTFTEIGLAYARTQERIRQIEDKAMRKLKYLVQQKNNPELAKHLGL